jgi:gliding motility-associated-like protein/uncharacterized repeat protein (TIGR01451 family)
MNTFIKSLSFLLLLFGYLIIPKVVNAQGGCNSQNVTVSNFFFTDANGDPFDPSVEFPLGTPVNGFIKATFGGSSGNGYSIYVEYDVVINDEFVRKEVLCLFEGTRVVMGTPQIIDDFTWNWGDKFEIKNFFMSWKTNSGGTCEKLDRNSQCWSSVPGFLVKTPLVANFDFDSNCNDYEVDFEALSTGGEVDAYTHNWNFAGLGNATTSSNDPNTSFVFPGPGSYDVTLITNDGIVSKSITKTVELYSLLNLSYSIGESDCLDDNSGTITLTVAGGVGPYTYEWSTSDGSGIEQGVKDQSGLSSGTYTVKVTDERGCFESLQIEVKQPDQAPAPDNLTNEFYCENSGIQQYNVIPTEGYQLIFYETNTSVSPLSSVPNVDTDQSGAGEFSVWVSQNKDGECESDRVEVKIIVQQAPLAPVTGGDQMVCATDPIQTLTANATVPSGFNIVWFSSVEGGEIVSPTLNSIGSITYYAEAVNSETQCVSLSRTPVTLTINDCQVNISKSVDKQEIESPGTLNYTVTLSNPGNIGLAGVVVTDPLTNGNDPLVLDSGDSNGDNILDINETWVFKSSYEVTQQDIDKGSDIVNIAYINSELVAEQNASATTSIIQTAGISIQKTADKTSDVQAGDVITYTYVVTNTGNVTVSGVDVSDSHPGTGTLGDITTGDATDGVLPGGTVTFTATYTVTQEDIDNNTAITNTATATATGANNAPAEATDTETITPEAASASIEITKTGTYNDTDGDGRASAGDQITYTFTVENTGNVTLTGVTVTDPKVTVSGTPIAVMAPGALDGSTFTAVYTLTQADIDAGTFTNTAAATGQYNGDVTDTDDDVQTFTRTPAIDVQKTANKTSGIQAGDVITYTYVVTNTGNITIDNVSISDIHPGTGTLSTPSTSDPVNNIAPGETVTFTATYIVTVHDITNNIPITNTVTANARGVNNTNVTATDTETITPEVAAPEIKIIKTGEFEDTNQNGRADAGDRITYTFTVENTGNVTLGDVVVTDPKVTVSGNPIAMMAPGALDGSTFTAVYTLTQADIDAGTFTNTATATGQYNGDVSDTDDDVQNFVRIASITLQKTANKTTNIQAGDVIDYTYVVTNTGNVTVSSVTVNDAHPGTGILGDINTTDPVDNIAPGEDVTFTASYTVTVEDITNNVPITNTATATATGADNGSAMAIDTETITPEAAAPSISIIKVGTYNDTNGDGRASAGDQISYAFTLENTGNVTLTNVVVTDPLVTVNGSPIAVMAPGAVDGNTFTAVYTLTQSDIDAGTFTNTATAVGQYNGAITATDTDVQNFERVSSISLTKTANKTSVRAAGDEIVYTLTVTNTGNVTITDIVKLDKMVSYDKNVGILAPGESISVDITYVVTQGDIDRGSIENIASVIGQDPEGSDTGDEDRVVIEVEKNPSISLTKTANKTSVSAAGEEIVYTLTVTNTGNLTINDITKFDPMVSYENNVGSLAPNESASIDITYVVTQEDMDRGSIENIASVSGKDPNGENVSDEDSIVIDVEKNASFNILKSANKSTVSVAGEEIEYTITVTNTGNVTLDDVVVVDELVNLNQNVGTLAPGENKSLSVSYVVTQSDMDNGSIVNIATVIGTDPDGNDAPGSEDDVTVVVEQNASISMSKTANKTIVNEADEEIVYTLTVTNTGNVTLSNVMVVDEKVGVNQNIGTLLPGESTVINVIYTVTQADIDSGSILNIASVIGNDPKDEDASGEDSVTVNVSKNAQIEIVKTSTNEDYTEIGQEIVYTITVTNTGNVTLSDILISDPLTGFETSVTTLAPGVSVSFETIYSVGLEDLERGVIVNNVTVTANDPDGEEISGGDSISITGSANRIIANDDEFGDFVYNYTGSLGNILENDLLEGQRPDPSDVDFEFTDLDGIIGLNINENGELSLLIPEVNEAREYTLRYVLRETLNPTNSDNAIVTFRLLNPDVDLSVTKTSDNIEIFEGDEFDYVITVSNNGGTDATDVEVTDELPAGVSYISSDFVSTDERVELNMTIQSNNIVWSIPFLPADAVVTITLKVKANALVGENPLPLTITNNVTVVSSENEINPGDNTATDVNTVQPFFIPNVITPNGDGRNDTFEVKGLGKFVSNEIVILNRYGDTVFQRSNYGNDWDAPGQGAGTYFYVLTGVDSQGRSHVFKGWIQVIR